MKTTSARVLKRGQPEEKLSQGETHLVKKAKGKKFELGRVDALEPVSIHAATLDVLREVPNPSKAKTDVAKWCAEDDL